MVGRLLLTPVPPSIGAPCARTVGPPRLGRRSGLLRHGESSPEEEDGHTCEDPRDDGKSNQPQLLFVGIPQSLQRVSLEQSPHGFKALLWILVLVAPVPHGGAVAVDPLHFGLGRLLAGVEGVAGISAELVVGASKVAGIIHLLLGLGPPLGHIAVDGGVVLEVLHPSDDGVGSAAGNGEPDHQSCGEGKLGQGRRVVVPP